MKEGQFEPVIGQWYRDIDDRIFEVVAIDDDGIEIQFYDGDVEELEMDIWEQLEVTAIAEPNSGSGPFEESEDEFSILAEEYRPSNW